MKKLILILLILTGISYSQLQFPANTFWKDSSGVTVPKKHGAIKIGSLLFPDGSTITSAPTGVAGGFANYANKLYQINPGDKVHIRTNAGDSTRTGLFNVYGIADIDSITSDSISSTKIKANNLSVSSTYNTIAEDGNRDSDLSAGFANGHYNTITSWDAMASGTANFVDGKISIALGNTNIATGNDGTATGNRTAIGRRYYEIVYHGVDDSLGSDKAFILIPYGEGDVSSYFPYAGINNITTRYGAGSDSDVVGNIYSSGYTKAVWDGSTLLLANDLTWALHPFCIVRGGAETDISLVRILSAVYSAGWGTKVYYDSATEPFADMIGIYSSYNPTVIINAINAGGNGQHSEGRLNSAWGNAAHVEGGETRAWGHYSHAQGYQTRATGQGSHSEGWGTTASGLYSHAQGAYSTASGSYSHAEGYYSIASGMYSHAQGYATYATGLQSFSFGKESLAKRIGENSYSNGKFTFIGDVMHNSIMAKTEKAGVGWHEFPIWEFTSLTDYKGLDTNRTYSGTIHLTGRQITNTVGEIGESIAYKIDFGFETRKEYSVVSVNADSNIVVISTTTALPLNTPLLFQSTGSTIGGLDETSIWYVKTSSNDTIQLSYSIGGARTDLTSAGSGTMSFMEVRNLGVTRYLIGKTFLDDGDTVGDGLTTGIRATLLPTYFLGRNPTIRIDGLANRTLRWTAYTEWTEIAY